jgi:4-alpha-glucanotransferase
LQLIGDIPFYVAEDSSDVWANRLLFDLDENGCPNRVAGVPPDYFSKTGQMWGFPIYHWESHRRVSYEWWMNRIAAMLRMVDLLRIDHFRAFYNYWSIEADKTFWGTPQHKRTAMNGQWIDWDERERTSFFIVHMEPESKTRLIAENLGADMGIVDAWLENTLELPGMQVLQFAFGDDTATEERFLPKRFDGDNHRFVVMYTGTHDNNTACGWWKNETGEDAGPLHKKQVREFAKAWQLKVNPDDEPHWALIELAMRSNARIAIVPMQDILGLPQAARMNKPQQLNYWRWRCTEADLSNKAWKRLHELTIESQRLRK